MSDCKFDVSASDDEMLMFVAAQSKIARTIRPRPNNFELWTDEEFFMRFRLTRPTVLQLFVEIEHELESPIDRNSPAVSPINQLLLALRVYATGCMLIAAGDFAGIHMHTAGVVVKRVTKFIASLCKTYVKFPSTPAGLRVVQEGFYAKSKFPRVIGAIGCTHIKLLSPLGENAETFRNQEGNFSLKVQTISDPWLRIINVVARWPGSCPNKTIFSNSLIKARLERGEFGDGLIVGDSGYTLSSYMIMPLRNPVLAEEMLFNEAQIQARNVVERQNSVWKRRFPVLYTGIRLAVETVHDIVVACAVLHNMAINSKEAEPPVDPELSLQSSEDGQMPHIGAAAGGAAAMQQTLIGYFRTQL